MKTELKFASQKILFVSDAHLDPREEPRLKSFLTMLQKESLDCQTIIILGDLFEFWFEYRHAVFIHYLEVLLVLKQLIVQGKKIIFLAGNHDFSLGTVFSKVIGMDVYQEPVAVQIDTFNVYLSHGDLINTRDYGYRILRCVVRSPLTQFIFRLIPPDLGWRLATRLSQTSKTLHEYKHEVSEDTYHSFLYQRVQDGFDVVMHGHFHQQYMQTVRFSSGQDIMVLNPGDWIHSFSWIIYDNGRFILRHEEL